MAQQRPIRNSNPEHETFHKFFKCWLIEQDRHLYNLVSTSKNQHNNDRTRSSTSTTTTESTQELIDQVLQHYEHYYRAKSRWAKDNVLSMLTPSWRSTLKDAFLWIRGWRPSMAFHLLYSKSGLQLEARLDELIHGLSTGDLGDLLSTQLSRVNDRAE
ncbi:hypothetical protein ACSBR2_009236 [Camellia fascicularis]